MNKAHDKEIEAAHLENELSRIRVDTLNTDAHNVQLKEMLDKKLAELKDKVCIRTCICTCICTCVCVCMHVWT